MPNKILHNALSKVHEVLHENKYNWSKLPDIVSIGIGYVDDIEMGIIIGTSGDVEFIQKKIPESIDGVKIQIKKKSKIVALNDT